MKSRNRSRGQALFETAIALPLFLTGLFGVMWAMKDSSLAARVELAVRYGGMVDSLQQPYLAYSLYDLYATVDNVVPAQNAACYAGNATELTSGYAPFWLPTSSAPLVSPCSTTVDVITGPETYTQPVILRNNYSSITATAPASGYISSKVLGGASTSTVKAAENFFRPPDVGTVLTCTTLGPAFKGTIEGKSDTGVATVQSTLTGALPLPPAVIPTSAVVLSTAATGTCYPTTSSYTAPASPY